MAEFRPVKWEEIFTLNRPTLGSDLPVLVYRILRGVAMEQMLGESAGPSLYMAGRVVGLTLDVKTPEEFLKTVVDLKIGIPKIIEQSETRLVVQVDECASCSGMANIGRMFCHFEGGIIAGALEKILGKKVKATEIKCWGNGDGTCVFNVDIF